MRDEAGFAAFVSARGPALLRLAWLLTADADAAQDLAQEALVRLVPHWDRVSTGTGNPEAYARTALRSIWVDGWRRRRGWVTSPVDDVPEPRPAGPGPDDDLQERTVSRQAVVQALRQLPPGQRAVLVLRFYEDLTEVETARLLGISPSTVKTQSRDALARLRADAPWLDPTALSGDLPEQVTP
jgi:RNA polymerase sigma-70 factor (sigma-E family)